MCCSKTFIIIMWTAPEYNSFQISLMNAKFRRTSEIEIFCNIINVFIITFDRFNASLLNKSTNFYNPPPRYTESKPLNGIVYNVTQFFISDKRPLRTSTSFYGVFLLFAGPFLVVLYWWGTRVLKRPRERCRHPGQKQRRGP